MPTPWRRDRRRRRRREAAPRNPARAGFFHVRTWARPRRPRCDRARRRATVTPAASVNRRNHIARAALWVQSEPSADGSGSPARPWARTRPPLLPRRCAMRTTPTPAQLAEEWYLARARVLRREADQHEREHRPLSARVDRYRADLLAAAALAEVVNRQPELLP